MQQKRRHVVWLVALLSLWTAACAPITPPAFAPEAGVGAETVNGEWTIHLPGGDTSCAGGTPFAFHTRQTGSEQLLIYLQEGGGCVAGYTCDPANPQMFDPSVVIPGDPATQSGTFWDNDDPRRYGGIFDVADARNPFAGYNMLYIPYCTGDAHLGNNVNAGVHHKGAVNATAALAWAFSQLPDVTKIVVAGGSAGGIAAPFHAGAVARAYPAAEIYVLSDSNGSYGLPVIDSLTMWGAAAVMATEFGTAAPAAAELDAELDFETAIFVNAKRYPNIAFARFDTTGDSAQNEFNQAISFGQNKTSVAEFQAIINAELAAAVERYHTYQVDGSYHMILATPRFYRESADGVTFYEWVTAFVNGEAVESVGP